MSSKLRETINRVMWEDHDGGKARLYTTDELEAAIKAYILDEIIGEDEENYRPYLVVRHKLGLEENQTQARLIATAVNQLRAEQRKMLQ